MSKSEVDFSLTHSHYLEALTAKAAEIGRVVKPLLGINELSLAISRLAMNESLLNDLGSFKGPVIICPILNGGLFFTNKLLEIWWPHAHNIIIHPIQASSYELDLDNCGRQVSINVNRDVFNKLLDKYPNARVLIVDDIHDSGKTLTEVTWALLDQCNYRLHHKPITATLVAKSYDDKLEWPDYHAVAVMSSWWLVGAGMDLHYMYRDLPMILALPNKDTE